MAPCLQNRVGRRDDAGQHVSLFAGSCVGSSKPFSLPSSVKNVSLCLAMIAGLVVTVAPTARANTTAYPSSAYPSSEMPPFVIIPGAGGENAPQSSEIGSASPGFNRIQDQETRSDDYSTLTQPDTIKIDRLGDLNSDTFGLDAGYGPDIWRGSRSAYIIPAMQRLSAFGNLELLARMEKVLLRGKASSPSGKYDGISWFVARLQRLMNLGDVNSVIELIDKSGAYKQNPHVAKIYAEAWLALGNFEQACGLRKQTRLTRLKLFFAELNLVCLLQAKQLDAAAMNLDLSSGLIEADSFFSQLAYGMAVNMPVERIDFPSQFSILQTSLLRVSQLEMTSPLASYPMAMSALLASEHRHEVGLQIGSAMRAARYGGLSIDALRNLIDMNEDRILAVDANLASASSTGLIGPSRLTKLGAIGLAQSYLRINNRAQASEPNDVSGELAAYLARAAENDIWGVAVRLVNTQIETVMPKTRYELALFALASLQLGAVDRAQAFIDALASGVNEPRSGLEQVLAFWREPGGAYSMSSNAFNTDPNSGLLDPEKSFTDIAYQALDVPRILPTGEVVVTAYDPDLVVNQAKRLSRSGRLGDLVIFMQERLAQKPFSEWRDEDVYAAIEPMAYIGLRPEARALAKEIILQKALSDLVANENSNENSKARPISPDRTDLNNGSARQQAMPTQ